MMITYNSNQVAEIIGVNVSTIKRWTDSGKLTCQQTHGGHRKFHLNHLRDFLRKNKKHSSSIKLGSLLGKNKKVIDAIESNDTNIIIDYLYRNTISGNESRFLAVNNSLILKGYPLYFIFDDIVNPLLTKIGTSWQKGKISISQEHLATVIIRKFLSNLNFDFVPKKSNQISFCFTLPDDSHDLPLYMAESIMNQNNIKTYNLGANLPVYDFIDLANKVSPDIVLVSVIYIKDLKKINQELNLLCKHFLKSNTKIILRGISVNKVAINYNNFFHIATFEDFQKLISNESK